MPTGYTYKIVNEGQTFPEFAMGCARAFGALIHMRDDPWGAPLRLRQQSKSPHSLNSYHAEAKAKAEERLKRLEGFDVNERLAYGEHKKQKEIDELKAHIERIDLVNAKIAAMQKDVQEWKPPTEGHLELKKFMLQQLDVSKESCEYEVQRLAYLTAKSAAQVYEDVVAEDKSSVEYHTRMINETPQKSENNVDPNAWIIELCNSLGVEPPTE